MSDWLMFRNYSVLIFGWLIHYRLEKYSNFIPDWLAHVKNELALISDWLTYIAAHSYRFPCVQELHGGRDDPVDRRGGGAERFRDLRPTQVKSRHGPIGRN
jgi:hypothetical protein